MSEHHYGLGFDHFHIGHYNRGGQNWWSISDKMASSGTKTKDVELVDKSRMNNN